MESGVARLPGGAVSAVVIRLGHWEWPAYSANRLLQLCSPFRVGPKPYSLVEGVQVLRAQHPTVAVLIPSGFSSETRDTVTAALHSIKEASSRTRVVLLSQQGRTSPSEIDPDVRPLGYVSTTDLSTEESLITAVRAVGEGMAFLSPSALDSNPQESHDGRLAALTEQQREVLRLMADGLSNQGIAEQMVLSLKAVENYVGAIFRSLGINGDGNISRRVAATNIYRSETVT